MPNIKTHSPKRELLILAGEIIILFLCAAYIYFIYQHNIFPDKQLRSSFQTVNCVVLQSNLSARGRVIPHYRSNFQVAYQVEGKKYKAWVTSNGLDKSYSSDRTTQVNFLKQYQPGKQYTCFYNATNPEAVSLVLRQNWNSTFILLIPFVIALVTFYYMCRTLFVLFNVGHYRK